jgi:hypothetical protein
MRTTVKSNNSGGSNKTWANYNNSGADYPQQVVMNSSGGSKGLSANQRRIMAIAGA